MLFQSEKLSACLEAFGSLEVHTDGSRVRESPLFLKVEEIVYCILIFFFRIVVAPRPRCPNVTNYIIQMSVVISFVRRSTNFRLQKATLASLLG